MSDELADAVKRLADAIIAQRREARPPFRDPPVRREPGRRYDYLGRKTPSKLDAVSFARGLNGYAAQFDRTVPADLWRRREDLGLVVEVSCPCGERHLIERFAHVGAACGRHFVWDGSDVHVAGLKS